MKDNSVVQVIELSRYLLETRLLNQLLCSLWSLTDGKDFDKILTSHCDWLILVVNLIGSELPRRISKHADSCVHSISRDRSGRC